MRYYYTDPLAAAWMAKHFRMKFNRMFVYPDPAYNHVSGSVIEDVDGCLAHNCMDLLYIHPDSLHLLEPIEDDVIDMRPDGFLCIFLKDGDYEKLESDCQNIVECFTSNAIMKGDCSIIETDWKVIQRNGIPFHWPEVEA